MQGIHPEYAWLLVGNDKPNTPVEWSVPDNK